MEHTQDGEGPIGAMPDVAEQHGEQEVGVTASGAVSVAAEVDEEVVAKKPAESPEPASPEIQAIAGLIGGMEINGQADTDEAGQAYDEHRGAHGGFAGAQQISCELGHDFPVLNDRFSDELWQEGDEKAVVAEWVLADGSRWASRRKAIC